MNKIIHFIIFSIVLNGIKCINFSDCGSTTGRVTNISVSDCPPEATLCPFKSGTNVSIDVNFESEVDSNTANVKVWGIIGGLPIPFNLQPSNACNNWNIKCPLTRGSANNLKITMRILSQYPKIQVGVRLALIDSTSNKLVCQQFPAQIM